MAVLVAALPASTTEDVLPHKTWTRDELRLIEDTGVLEGTHFELIEGDLIDKMGKKYPHMLCTRLVLRALEAAFGADYVAQEGSMDVAPRDNPRNEPEPDVIALRSKFADLGRIPAPSDVALVVEVSDTTLRQDLTTKAHLYARAGIGDYWVLDIPNRTLHVLREPTGSEYAVHLTMSEFETVAPLEHPDYSINVSALFR